VRPPDLLAPAGTPAKLRTALHFGADAVYLGLRRYSLRAGAGNFTLEQLDDALSLTRSMGRRVYVAINLQPFDEDLDASLIDTLEALADLKPDALIVADPGVMALCRRHAPELPLHLSTQASVTNAAAARFWHEAAGVQRIIAARELSLEQLGAMVGEAPEVRFEAFAHGAVCVAYSGRCLLSLYGAGPGRDPRRGSCAQGCRWRYRFIEDGRRPGEANPVEQDERGTYFFDARDLCAMPVLDRLVETGVRALKLEGRTRSALYLAVTVDIYRHALDRLADGDARGFAAAVPDYLAGLREVSTRPFSTHFYTGEQDRPETYLPGGMPWDGAPRYVGEVEAPGTLRLKNPVSRGDSVTLCDRGLKRQALVLDPLLDQDGAPVPRALAGDTITLPDEATASPGAVAMRR